MLTPQQINEMRKGAGFEPLNAQTMTGGQQGEYAGKYDYLLQKETPQPEKKKGFFESIIGSIQNRGTKLAEDLIKQGEKVGENVDKGNVIGGAGELLRAGLRTTGAVAGGVFDVAGEGIKRIPGVESGMEKIKTAIKKTPFVGEQLIAAKKIFGDQFEETYKKNPEVVQDVIDAMTTAGLVTLPADLEGVAKLVQAAKSSAKSAIIPPGGTLETAIDTAKSKIKEIPRPSEIIENTQNYLARKSVGENFPSSVKRLSETENPLSKYNEFYDQELKFKTDAKQDTAISKVGENIGNSYNEVISQRRKIGSELGDEIKNIGTIKTEINDTFGNLETELFDNGITFDANKGVQLSRTSKLTKQDAQLLNEYITELNDLGTNPTAQELDAFLSRIPNNIDVYKGTNNITKVTNAERIIKNHLKQLRDKLSPTVNPAFAKYYGLKKDYSALTDFLDEGAKFLGGKSQAGDYVKDASLAKSAIQSVLNQGKKDWLLKLEDLTGYKAVDEAVLALQAMKDAGNFRGNSLLELLTEGSQIPTSFMGLKERLFKKGIDIGSKKIVGTEADQTRRVITEEMNKSIPPK